MGILYMDRCGKPQTCRLLPSRLSAVRQKMPPKAQDVLFIGMDPIKTAYRKATGIKLSEYGVDDILFQKS